MSCLYVSTNGERTWRDLFPYVAPHAPKCPPDIMANALRDSAIELCQRTGILREKRTASLQKGVPDYPLCPTDGYQIVRVTNVRSGSICSVPSGSEWCTCGRYRFYMPTSDYLVFSDAPSVDTAGGLEVEFVVAPTRDSLVLDGLLYEQWGEGLASGALSRLLLIANSPWYNTVLAEYHRREWRSIRSRARVVAEKGHTERAIMMSAPRWL